MKFKFINLNAPDLGENTPQTLTSLPQIQRIQYGNESVVYAMDLCRSYLGLRGSGSVERIEEEDDGGDELLFLLPAALDEVGGRRSRLPMATLRRRAGGTSLGTSVVVGRASSVRSAASSTPRDPPPHACFCPPASMPAAKHAGSRARPREMQSPARGRRRRKFPRGGWWRSSADSALSEASTFRVSATSSKI
jgi:hypothetical protein